MDTAIYYTKGARLFIEANIRIAEGVAKQYKLDRNYCVDIPVTIPANNYVWLTVE